MQNSSRISSLKYHRKNRHTTQKTEKLIARCAYRASHITHHAEMSDGQAGRQAVFEN